MKKVKVIAYKKQSAGILYIICTVFFILILAKVIESTEMTGEDVFLILSLSVITVSALVLSVQFLLLPSELITLANQQTLILPKGVTVSLDSIDDVTFKRATAKGVRYRWGSVTILTREGKYKIHYVADCEDVAIKLNQLVRKEQKKQKSRDDQTENEED